MGVQVNRKRQKKAQRLTETDYKKERKKKNREEDRVVLEG